MIVKGLDNSPWFEKYVWSYYWGTNIMLTVGFGDIVATTYQEAVCLIFIETFSCLVLAYNINCVGSLISNIRAQDIEKSKNFKIFKKLIIKNSLPEDLSWRINNYIEESINIKKKFSLEE
jgi:hyperpolarization activated cyclic nucleotide-gated potassium channel 2